MHISKRLSQIYKLIAYSYENEARALYVDISEEPGKSFSIDINKLIHEVYVSPFAPKCFFQLVKEVSLQRYNLNSNISFKSSNILLRNY